MSHRAPKKRSRVHFRPRFNRFPRHCPSKSPNRDNAGILPPAVHDMAIAFLTASWIPKIGYDKQSWFVVDRGVPHGSPWSPSRYNLLMDEFGERVSEVPTEVSDVLAVLFADDVLLAGPIPTRATEALGHSYKVGWRETNDLEHKTRYKPGSRGG